MKLREQAWKGTTGLEAERKEEGVLASTSVMPGVMLGAAMNTTYGANSAVLRIFSAWWREPTIWEQFCVGHQGSPLRRFAFTRDKTEVCKFDFFYNYNTLAIRKSTHDLRTSTLTENVQVFFLFADLNLFPIFFFYYHSIQ